MGHHQPPEPRAAVAGRPKPAFGWRSARARIMNARTSSVGWQSFIAPAPHAGNGGERSRRPSMRRRILAKRTRGTATSAGADISLAIDVEDDCAAPAITQALIRVALWLATGAKTSRPVTEKRRANSRGSKAHVLLSSSPT